MPSKKKPAPKPRRRSAVDGRYTKSKAKRTTVEERGAEVLWRGWAVVFADSEEDPFGPWCCYSTKKHANQGKAVDSDVVVPVALVRRKTGRTSR